MPKLRGLVVGAGVAGKAVAHCMSDDGRAETVAFCESLASQRKKAAEVFPEAVIGEDYRDLLDHVAPDFVVVAGPDHLHVEQAIVALESGCHVLIEKPMATTLADAVTLLATEARVGKHVMVDFSMRYVHPWPAMVNAVKAGEIGRIFYVGANYIHDMWGYPRASIPWRLDKTHPQNILLGGGCHGLDLMLWVMQDVPVDEVFTYGNHLSASPLPIDDCYVVAMRFDDGVVGRIFVASGANGVPFGPLLEVYGAEGTLREGKLYRRHEEPNELRDILGIEHTRGHGWAGAVTDFISLVNGEMDNPMPSLMGARNVAVCEAALLAMREGRPRQVQWIC